MTVAKHNNTILHLRDLVTSREYEVRINSEDKFSTLGSLLSRYLKKPLLDSLLLENRMTLNSFESLSYIQDLVYKCLPGGTLGDIYSGVVFKQGDQKLGLNDAPKVEELTLNQRQIILITINIDRTNVGYDRNWQLFHKRRWDKDPEKYIGFVENCLAIQADTQSFTSKHIPDNPIQQISFVKAIAHRIWDSDFENYSRFIDKKLMYKTGDETVDNIINGNGGICSEKVQALKFITDSYGIESEYLISGPNVSAPVPESKLRDLLYTFDFRFSKRYMRYWQHVALLYKIGTEQILVDVTNGNIPFLFEYTKSSNQLLGYEPKKSVPVKMAIVNEDFYYHRVAQDIPQNLFFAMEGWIQDIDLVQVFDNELGLYISNDFMISPILYRNMSSYEQLRTEYLKIISKSGLEFSVTKEWTFDNKLGELFTNSKPDTASKIIQAKEHLELRYSSVHGEGNKAGMVIIQLDA